MLPSFATNASIEDLARPFLALFCDRADSVVKQIGSKNWREVSKFYSLSDEDILQSIQTDAKLMRGCRFDKKTAFLALRISSDSRYHNLEAVTEIRQALKSLTVNVKHYQLEDDWFLYIFFNNWAPVEKCSELLRSWCQVRGLVLGSDGIEIFPSEIALPLPLQPGFAWLNEQCQLIVRRDELPLKSALALFLADIVKGAANVESFLAVIAEDIAAVSGANDCLDVSSQQGDTDEAMQIPVPELVLTDSIDQADPIVNIALGVDVGKVSGQPNLKAKPDCHQWDDTVPSSMVPLPDRTCPDIKEECQTTETLSEAPIQLRLIPFRTSRISRKKAAPPRRTATRSPPQRYT